MSRTWIVSKSGIGLTAEIAAFICRKLHQKRLRQSKVMKFEAHANAEKFMIINGFDVNNSHLAGIFPGIHLYLSPGFSSYTFFNRWQYTCYYSKILIFLFFETRPKVSIVYPSFCLPYWKCPLTSHQSSVLKKIEQRPLKEGSV